ncbi:hypothetical protein Glove_306g63 [Diversispora epigaea]|uniref:SAM domain-containing protein n=1 Tax=Diversispora epigaea TaxID=1348612 RepID=A0A397HXB3_9GLOM|nr:hypothetical protein Glove_306g63 [Diversispora epigaea]
MFFSIHNKYNKLLFCTTYHKIITKLASPIKPIKFILANDYSTTTTIIKEHKQFSLSSFFLNNNNYFQNAKFISSSLNINNINNPNNNFGIAIKRYATTTQSPAVAKTKFSENFYQLVIDGFKVKDYYFLKQPISTEEEDKFMRFYKENYLDEVNYKLLEDFPAWLSGFGLGDLGDKFEGYHWQEITEMTWQDLDNLGIKFPYLRKILLKNFILVKYDQANKRGIHIDIFTQRARRLSDLEAKIPIDFTLLQNDFAGWLESIGCGVYASHFEGKSWKEVIYMDWKELEALGMRSRGLRTRLVRFCYRAREELEETLKKLDDTYSPSSADQSGSDQHGSSSDQCNSKDQYSLKRYSSEDQYSPDRHSSDRQSLDKYSSERYNSDRDSSDRQSLDKYSSERYNSDRDSSDRNNLDRYSSDRYISDRYSSNRYSSDRYSSDRNNSNQYSQSRYNPGSDQYSSGRYSSDRRNSSQYSSPNRYGSGQYRDSSDRYNSDRYSSGQYRNNSDRYSSGQYRDSSDRYSSGQYRDSSDRYDSDRYSSGQYRNSSDRYGSDRFDSNSDRYGSDRYSPDRYSPDRFDSNSDRYGSDRYRRGGNSHSEY